MKMLFSLFGLFGFQFIMPVVGFGISLRKRLYLASLLFCLGYGFIIYNLFSSSKWIMGNAFLYFMVASLILSFKVLGKVFYGFWHVIAVVYCVLASMLIVDAKNYRVWGMSDDETGVLIGIAVALVLTGISWRCRKNSILKRSDSPDLIIEQS